MPKQVYLLTVQEAHKEYNSLVNQIWAKYEQLDSGEFGAVGTITFNNTNKEFYFLFFVTMNHVTYAFFFLQVREMEFPSHFECIHHGAWLTI